MSSCEIFEDQRVTTVIKPLKRLSIGLFMLLLTYSSVFACCSVNKNICVHNNQLATLHAFRTLAAADDGQGRSVIRQFHHEHEGAPQALAEAFKVYRFAQKSGSPIRGLRLVGLRPVHGRASKQYPSDRDASRPPTSTPETPATLEKSVWEIVKNSKNPADYEDYLKVFPKGHFAKMAREKLKELEAHSLPSASSPETPKEKAIIAPPNPKTTEIDLQLTSEERVLIQRALKAKNYDPGYADGLFGVKTREAIRRYQSAAGVPKTGYLTLVQAKALINDGKKVSAAPRSKQMAIPNQANNLPRAGDNIAEEQPKGVTQRDEKVEVKKQNENSDPIPKNKLVIQNLQFDVSIDDKRLMLEGLIVRPMSNRRFPLIVFAHGSTENEWKRKAYAPIQYLPQAEEFARRGYVAFVLNRRGYGKSQGQWKESRGKCKSPDYMTPTREAAKDLVEAVRYAQSLPYVDGERVLLLGVSGGGMPVLSLLSQKSLGIVGGIVISGIRGSRKDRPNCDKKQLLDVIGRFGKDAQVPSLWVYVKNDRYTSPDLAEAMYRRYTSSGASAQLVFIDSYRSNGSLMFFRKDGIPLWRNSVDVFLRAHNLPTWKTPPTDPPYKKLPSPAGLTNDSPWEQYLIHGPHKAFAVDLISGAYGYMTGMRTLAEAKERALQLCARAECKIVSVDDQEVGKN